MYDFTTWRFVGNRWFLLSQLGNGPVHRCVMDDFGYMVEVRNVPASLAN